MKGNIAVENIFLRYGIIIFIFLSFILYGKTIGHKFSLDDEYVVKNELVTKGVKSIPEIFKSYYSGNEKEKYGYRPVTRAMYAIEYQIFGLNTKAFHFINVLIYGLLCWILYLVLLRIKSAVPHTIAILSVLLFLFHPVHTEVVNSLKNREELLCFIFSLLALLNFLHFAKSSNVFYLITGLVLLFIAFLSKETAFVFTLIVPLYLFIAGVEKKRTLICTVLSFVILILAYKTPSFILPDSEAHVEFWQNPLFGNQGFLQSFSMGMSTLAHYSLQLLFPYKLLFYYGYNMIPLKSVFSFTVISSFIIHAALFVIALLSYRKNKVLSFGILLYFFAISMFSNIYMPITGIVADRLVFVASAGFCIVFAFILLRILNTPSINKISYILIPATFIFYTYVIFNRNNDWKSTETLYEADIKYLHNSVKANDLYASYYLTKANNLIQAGRKPSELGEIAGKATQHFKRVTELMPDHYNAWNNLGSVYLTFYKDTANALFSFMAAVNSNPGHTSARHNIGYIYYKAKKYDLAKKEFKLALQNDSMYIPSLFSYGEILTIEQNFDSAKYYFLMIYKKDSTHTGALLNLGSLGIIRGDTIEALKYYESAINYDKSNKALINNIADYYFKKGDSIKSAYYRKMTGL